MKKILALMVVVLAATCVFAQEPMKTGSSPAMDISGSFPTSIIDTITLPVNGFEVGVSGTYVTTTAGRSGVFYPNAIGSVYYPVVGELTYGVIEDLQVTAKWPVIFGEGMRAGNGDTVIAGLWQAVKDDGTIPAMALELAAKFPTGKGFTGYDGTITGVISKAFGELRVFANAGYTTIGKDMSENDKPFFDLDGDLDHDGDEVAFGKRAHTDSFKLGAAYMAMDDLCVIVDVASNMSILEGEDRVDSVEVGARYAMTEVDIISAGIGVGVGNGNATPDLTATLGYQRELQ